MPASPPPPAPSGPCPVCGASSVTMPCETCERRRQAAVVRRELMVLSLLVVATAVGFVMTQWAAAANERRRHHDAEAWFERGQARLAANELGPATAALRTASTLDSHNEHYLLTLAAALTANHDDDGARQILLRLRQQRPESGPINLELARIEVRRSDAEAAAGYYQNALYGRWESGAAPARNDVRIELIDYLLTRGEPSRALSELLVLDASLPDTPAAHRQVGQLFLAAGEPGRALEHLRRSLAANPADGVALAAAAAAAFALADYTIADRYLQAAPDTAEVRALRQLTRLVLTKDPMAPRLLPAERRRRLSEVLSHARTRLEGCLMAAGDLAPSDSSVARVRNEAQALASALAAPRWDPDLVEDGLRLAWRLEESPASHCGPADDFDRAVQLIARRHGVDQS